MEEKYNNRILPEYDIVIVGAGPAGCSVANFLSKDYKVLLLDWSRFPRDKPCGGILVEETQNFISKIILPKSIFSYPKFLNLKYTDWNNNLEVNQKRSFLNVNRRSFDYWLLELSKGKIHFSPKTKFLDFEKKENGTNILIEKNNEKKIIKSKYLVGACGASSNLIKNVRKKQIRQYLAVQYWIRSDKDINNLHFIYDNDITDFYSWIIPKGNYLIIGSALPKDNINEKFQLFENKLKEKMNIHEIGFKKEIAIISRPESINDIVFGDSHMLLVGESAGFISSSTGEGISFALKSGYNCAQALNYNFENAFEKYKELCQPLLEEIMKKIKKAEILSNPVKRLGLFKTIK